MSGITGIHSQFLAVAHSLAGSVLFAAKVALPSFLIAMLAYSYVKSILSHRSFEIDYRPVIRTLILMFVVNFYPEIMGMISTTVSGVIGVVPRKPNIGEAIRQMAEATMSNSKDPDPTDDWWDPIVVGFESILSMKAWILSALQEGILFIVRAGIGLIRSMLLVFLYITGPIAIALSVLPGFHQASLTWLKGSVGVQFWELTLRILDQMVYQYNLAGLQNFDAGLQDAGYGMAFNLVAILMYLMTPSLTNYYVNTGAAGGFMARIAQTAAATLFLGKSLINRGGVAAAKHVGAASPIAVGDSKGQILKKPANISRQAPNIAAQTKLSGSPNYSRPPVSPKSK